jgi:hypothetical protein
VNDSLDLQRKGVALMSAKEVHALIRERIGVGQLPSGPGDKIYGGKGSNTACACCGRTIAWHEIEYEVHFNSFPHTLSMHLDCYRIWWEERRSGEFRKGNERG